MADSAQRFKFWGALFVAVSGSGVLLMASVAQGPDRRIDFHRETGSARSPSEVAPFLNDPAKWPQWFHALKQVRSPDGNAAAQPLEPGRTQLRLLIEPPKKEWKRFELEVRVTAFEPGRKLELELVKDSTGKLDRLFSKIRYRVELRPDGTGTRILGNASALTRNWRSRLFGWMIPRILMHQIFYPDLIELAKLPKTEHEDQQLQLAPSAF